MCVTQVLAVSDWAGAYVLLLRVDLYLILCTVVMLALPHVIHCRSVGGDGPD